MLSRQKCRKPPNSQSFSIDAGLLHPLTRIALKMIHQNLSASAPHPKIFFYINKNCRAIPERLGDIIASEGDMVGY